MNTKRQINTPLILAVLGIILCCCVVGAVVAFMALTSPAIGETFEGLGSALADMAALQQAVAAEYPEAESVGVNVMNGHILQVTLVNTDYNTLSDADQRHKAGEVAQFAKDNYAGIDSVDTINIQFTWEDRAGGFSITQSGNWNFDVAELE